MKTVFFIILLIKFTFAFNPIEQIKSKFSLNDLYIDNYQRSIFNGTIILNDLRTMNYTINMEDKMYVTMRSSLIPSNLRDEFKTIFNLEMSKLNTSIIYCIKCPCRLISAFANEYKLNLRVMCITLKTNVNNSTVNNSTVNIPKIDYIPKMNYIPKIYYIPIIILFAIVCILFTFKIIQYNKLFCKKSYNKSKAKIYTRLSTEEQTTDKQKTKEQNPEEILMIQI